MNYNLLDEKWIPVLYKDGIPARVNITEAFTQAGRIRQIAASNPMDRVAIQRSLFDLFCWCKGNHPRKKETTSLKSFPSAWFQKLDDNGDWLARFKVRI